mgnify:CR=1 FL=1
MENLLVEEEQISLLGKMLYYSANHLTKREREVYDGLVDNLLRKVNQTRARERQAAHDGHPVHDQLDKQMLAKKNAIRYMRPTEVCQHFVDAWNKQDFESEFFCLSSHFPLRKKKTDNVNEYVLQRMQKYQERHNLGPVTKRVIEISSAETHGNKTSVYCIEVHRMPDHNMNMHRLYQLIFEDGGWRIADFETVKSHETPIGKKPHSDRKHQAAT